MKKKHRLIPIKEHIAEMQLKEKVTPSFEIRNQKKFVQASVKTRNMQGQTETEENRCNQEASTVDLKWGQDVAAQTDSSRRATDSEAMTEN